MAQPTRRSPLSQPPSERLVLAPNEFVCKRLDDAAAEGIVRYLVANSLYFCDSACAQSEDYWRTNTLCTFALATLGADAARPDVVLRVRVYYWFLFVRSHYKDRIDTSAMAPVLAKIDATTQRRLNMFFTSYGKEQHVIVYMFFQILFNSLAAKLGLVVQK